MGVVAVRRRRSEQPDFNSPDLRVVDNPFLQLRESDRARLTGLRILVVDDFGPDLNATTRKISSILTNVSGCTIEGMQDPEKALEYAVSEAKAGRPFNIFILDCAMETHEIDGLKAGINGDEFLKLYAEAAAKDPDIRVSPVVFHSGSHATGLQAWNYAEVEKIRRLDERLADAEVDKVIGGVPITLVLKDTQAVELIDAMSQMIRVGGRINRGEYVRYVASDQFKVSTLESDYDSEVVAAIARVGHLYAERTGEFLEEMREKYPWFMETEHAGELKEGYALLSSDEYRFHNLVGEDVAAAGRRHSLPGVFMQIEGGVERFLLDLRDGFERVPDGVDAEEFQRSLNRFTDDAVELGTVLNYYRYLKAAPRYSNQDLGAVLEQEFERMERRNKGTLNLPAEDILVNGPSDTLDWLVVQPIMNAEKFTNPKDREINIRFTKAKVGGLKPKVRDYFRGIGLSEADEVACVLVEDNGCGIPAENLDKIFDYGFTTGGTGIGLGLLSENIGKFKGTCDVESKVGEGTKFFMYFKLAE